MFEFILRLLGLRPKKKKVDQKPDTVEKIFLKALRHNFLFITGEDQEIKISRTDFSAFEKSLNNANSGFMLNTFTDDEQFSFMFFFPGKFMGHFQNKLERVHNIEKGMTSALKLVEWVDGNLSRLFFIKKKGMDPMEYSMEDFFKVPKEFTGPDREETLWRISGCEILKITVNNHDLYAFFNKDKDRELKNTMQSDTEFLRIIEDKVLSEFTGRTDDEPGTEDDISLNIAKPYEFVIGNFFMPLKTGFEGNRIKNIFKSITISSNYEKYHTTSGMWIRSGYIVEGKVYSMYHFFPDIDPGIFTDKFCDFK